jgi:hypothetical protein
MKILEKLLGPRSKYVKNIPYTYEARVDELCGQGKEPLYSYYYSDTICGLLEFLEKNEVVPENVEIFEVYQKGENKVMTKYCLDKKNHWLTRPGICKSLHDRYIGHVDEDHCAYRDRDRKGIGPY